MDDRRHTAKDTLFQAKPHSCYMFHSFTGMTQDKEGDMIYTFAVS